MEFTYQLTIAEHFVIQPDFQYIINPGAGINGDIENVFAGTIRLVISY
jgi:carbohydrate-selective porin OprB